VAIGASQSDGSDGQIFEIIEVRKHPGYVPSPGEHEAFQPANDVMLLRLATSSTAPFAAWNDNSAIPMPGVDVQMLGFGRIDPNDEGAVARVLQKVRASFQEDSSCDFFPFFQPDIMICAGETGTSTCSGDSGSPIFDIATNTIVGLSSFGLADCTRPRGFTQVSAYSDWFRDNACDLTRETLDFCNEAPPTDGIEERLAALEAKLAEVAIDLGVLGNKLDSHDAKLVTVDIKLDEHDQKLDTVDMEDSAPGSPPNKTGSTRYESRKHRRRSGCT